LTIFIAAKAFCLAQSVLLSVGFLFPARTSAYGILAFTPLWKVLPISSAWTYEKKLWRMRGTGKDQISIRRIQSVKLQV